MEEQKKGEEPRKESSEDYYSGYYWGNNPYDSSTVAGRKSDEELKNMIIEGIQKNDNIDPSKIEVYVNGSTVILKGIVETYEERRLAGQAAWNVSGVSKVLNDLQVTKPETAGPGKVSGSAS
jgi:osmotically-inducible protein OsmY